MNEGLNFRNSVTFITPKNIKNQSYQTQNTRKTSKITDGKDRNNKISNRNTNDEKDFHRTKKSHGTKKTSR